MPETLIHALTFGLLGLLIGSFLNVVIYRLPVMLGNAWKRESIAYLEGEGLRVTGANDKQQVQPFNLMLPRSRCGHCGHQITALENIPVLSYLALGGKCSACKRRISPRYPAIEILSAIAFAFCGYQWGFSVTAAAWAGFAAALIALVMIDWDTTLLPDSITLPLLWAGIAASLLGLTTTPLQASAWGAIAGYLSLWSVYWAFKLITKKEGMGHGDFKLLAALGAWLGIGALLPIVLASSLLGAIVGIILKTANALREGGYMPYGPFLGGAGLVIAATGTEWFYRLLLP